MKQTKTMGLILGIILLASTIPATASVPIQINYQGRLEDAGGPVDGGIGMTFRLFNVLEDGDPVWEEAHTFIEVNQGVYSVIMGTGIINSSYGTMEAALTSYDDLWIEVQVSGEPDAMAPRQKITSTGYAIRALVADTVADGGVTMNMLAVDSVTTEKIAAGAVTAEKIQGGTGSLVNADQVDGLEADAFALAGHDHDSVYYTRAQVDSLIGTLVSRIEALETKLANVTASGDDLIIEGMNVHIVNGQGSTNTQNGLGNLIVGYNEERSSGNQRSGSHNIITGTGNNYSSYGGLVAGSHNSVSGPYGTVSGGYSNEASGYYSSVSGGRVNFASGNSSSVTGGNENTASGYSSNVTSGAANRATGNYSSVTGGFSNGANGNYSSITGGGSNDATDNFSSVTGGAENTASGDYSSVTGGIFNDSGGPYSSITGGYSNDANGNSSSVTGGRTNVASGNQSSITGGQNNKATGDYSYIGGGGGEHVQDGNFAVAHYSAILGGLNNLTGDGTRSYSSIVFHDIMTETTNPDRNIGMQATINGGFINHASGNYSSVTGGRNNTASGHASFVGGGGGLNISDGNKAFADYSSILGGAENIAGDPTLSDHSIGTNSSVSGGFANTASGDYSGVSAGHLNTASQTGSSVSGGENNSANGHYSSVSGGNSDSVENYHDWRAGELFQTN